jgi:hypothetical protein
VSAPVRVGRVDVEIKLPSIDVGVCGPRSAWVRCLNATLARSNPRDILRDPSWRLSVAPREVQEQMDALLDSLCARRALGPLWIVGRSRVTVTHCNFTFVARR